MPERQTRRAVDYAAAAVIVGACTLLSGLTHWWASAETSIVMIYLAGVALTAARFGHGPALAAIVLSAGSYDYFFVPPMFAFAMVEPHYAITLSVMAAIGLLISELTRRLQRQLRASQLQERRSAQLYRMTRELGQASGLEELLGTACAELASAFDGEAVIFLREADGSIALKCGSSDVTRDPTTADAARWAFEQGRLAGRGADALPTAAALFAPMAGLGHTVGVLGVRPRQEDRFLDAEERRMLETSANLIAMSLERDQSLLETQRAHTEVETEKLRNTLLTSISHDLRTPLATIEFKTTGLLDESVEQSPAERRDVLETIVDQTRQLGRQVDNMLDMGRFNSAGSPLACEWQLFEELLSVALRRLRRELAGHTVEIDIPAEFPMLWLTADLFGQVLVNLLENAVQYTPAGSCIEISARQRGERAEISIADDGPGLPPGSEETVFEKFVRGSTKVADGRRGLGLGLTICRSIVRAHDGEITARNRSQGGAEFVISLPCPRESPQITLDEASLKAGAVCTAKEPGHERSAGADSLHGRLFNSGQ